MHQSLVVDTPGVHFTESILAALGHETERVFPEPFVKIGLVLVADPFRCAIDNHRGPVDGLLGGQVRVQTDALEPVHGIGVDRQPGAPPVQIPDFRAVVGQRSIFMETNFVDPQLLAVVAQQADERLADGTGPHYMNNFTCHPTTLRLFR